MLQPPPAIEDTDVARLRKARPGRVLLAMIAMAMAVAAIQWMIEHKDFFGSPPPRADRKRPAPPLPRMVDQALRPLTPEQALAANAAIAVARLPVETPIPFAIPASGNFVTMRHSAVDCLTAAVYYEAANEPDQGQRGVAQVVLNRVRHPAFPNSVCGVVFQGSERRTGCQFSFTCDGSLARRPSQSGWIRARIVAELALAGRIEPSVGMATHYHANYVLPYWASSLDKVNTIGAHIFYKWKGFWGKRSAFTDRYSGEKEEPPLDPSLGFDSTVFDDNAAMAGPAAKTDELGHLSAPVLADENKLDLTAPKAPPLQADESKGTLRADEQAGVLEPGSR